MSAQIGNANQTFGQATSNAQQTMNTAQAYNQQAQKSLQSITGANTGAANALMQNANQNLSTYGSTFVPLQQEQADQARQYTSAGNQTAQEGQAMAGVNTAFDQQRAASKQALAAEGVDAASIHGAALDMQSRVAQGAASAGAGTQAYQQNIQTGAGLTQQANQLGLGVGSAGQSGATAGAGVNTNTQQTINNTNSSGVNNLTAANTYLGTGVNANQSAANINSQQFQDQLAAYQAQQQSQNQVFGDIGTIAGAASKFAMLERGGPVPPGGSPIFSVPYASYDHGGPVGQHGALPHSPIPGSTDTKPALLTPGEFVVPKDVASWMGHEKLYKMLDKNREDMAGRHGMGSPMPSQYTARGV